MKKDISVVLTENGEKIVVIPKVIFMGKRSIDWDKVARYLVRYVGRTIEITDSNDFVYIGKDFVDEYGGSLYTKKLRGALAKAKANLVQVIPEVIQIAHDKRWAEDYGNKHKKKAENGWYRYNTKFALPVMDQSGQVRRYNKYIAVLIVRYASNGKLYLYDIQNIKKVGEIEI